MTARLVRPYSRAALDLRSLFETFVDPMINARRPPEFYVLRVRKSVSVASRPCSNGMP